MVIAGLSTMALLPREVAESLPLTLEHIQAARFTSAAGAVLLLYDHMITFADEVEFIWSAQWSLPKALFLFVRYAVPIAIFITLHQMSGLSHVVLSDMFCKIWFGTSTFLGMTTIAISNFLVLLRLWVIWDRNTMLMRWTTFCFVVTQLANAACALAALFHIIPNSVFNTELHMCILLARSNAVLLWAPGVFFEMVIFTTACWNALERPRDSHIANALYRDGFYYFIILFTLRIANLVIAAAAPLSLLFLGVYFIWCSTTVTLTRLIIALRRVSTKQMRNLRNQTTIQI